MARFLHFSMALYNKESIQEKGQEKEIEMLLEHWQVTK